MGWRNVTNPWAVGMILAASLVAFVMVWQALSAIPAPALDVQAATGLLAILVLLVVMNWFFHRVYWTGWIGLHHRRRKRVMERAGA